MSACHASDVAIETRAIVVLTWILSLRYTETPQDAFPLGAQRLSENRSEHPGQKHTCIGESHGEKSQQETSEEASPVAPVKRDNFSHSQASLGT